jgi:hypothetical protein
MENTFLPLDYVPPARKQSIKDRYLILKDGQNTFRILSSAITGYEYWNTENKPVRTKEALTYIPKDIRIEKDGKMSKIKHFWAFVVYDITSAEEADKNGLIVRHSNYIKIMELKQVTIQEQLKALVDNQKWGNPKNYDITITRTGEGLGTEYTVMPNPHSELPANVLDDYVKMNIHLEALYDGENPFGGEDQEINIDELINN